MAHTKPQEARNARLAEVTRAGVSLIGRLMPRLLRIPSKRAEAPSIDAHRYGRDGRGLVPAGRSLPQDPDDRGSADSIRPVAPSNRIPPPQCRGRNGWQAPE